jgi:hypothetical protein
MSIAKVSKSRLLWAEETAYATAPASGAYKQLPLSSESLVENIGRIVSDEIRSNRTVPAVRGGNIGTGGSITTDFGPVRHVRWLRHLLASAVTQRTYGALALTPDVEIPMLQAEPVSRGMYRIDADRIYLCVSGGTVSGADATLGLSYGGEGSPSTGQETLAGGTVWEYVQDASALLYEKTIVGGNDFPVGGLTFEKQILGGTALYVQFLGCRINTLGLTIPQEGIVQAEWGMVGLKSNKLGAAVDADPDAVSDDPFTGYEAYLGYVTGNNVGAARPIREGNINITNNIEESVYCWGSRFRKEVPPNRREVTGQITTYFETHDEYDFFKNETVNHVELSFNRNGLITIIDLPEVKLTGTGTPSISGQGVITAQFNLDPFNAAGAHDIRIRTFTKSNADITDPA